MTQRPARILPVIVGSQFAGTSLWFAGNAVMPDLQREWQLPASMLGYVTSAVQLGFILGTLVFAILAIADRHSPRKVFFACALLGALANAALLFLPQGAPALLASRFAAGFFLAGIYPVGMKIAAGWYRADLGKALGFLVGALVAGTAFPHLLKGLTQAGLGQAWPWSTVLLGVSLLAVAGGVAMLLVPDGPYLAKGAPFDPKALARVFQSRGFRASAFGYFGHMWELYAFWAFLPLWFAARPELGNPSLWTFAVIAAGVLGCVGGGLLSLRKGSAPVAFAQLSFSGLCCLASPLMFFAPPPMLAAFLLLWGVAVVGDSPQFSALNAANAPREWVGTALTIGNCIGFAITIASIQLLNALAQSVPLHWLFVLLAPGPALGLLALRPLLRK
jgi:MFS family permease